MLAIRMQRTGRKGLAQYRVVVQDSRQAPTSGRVVSLLGSYNPHTKTTTLKKEEAQRFLDNGAQPSERVAKLLKREGVKLPDWVVISEPKARTLRNPEKLRKNQPKEEAPVAEEKAEAPVEEAEAPVVDTTPKEEAAVEEKTDAPAEEKTA